MTSSTNNPKPLLEVKNVEKVFTVKSNKLFGKPTHLKALNKVSLNVYQGETLGVIGESGCGKTTLGKCIIRLIRATGGEILFRGENVIDMNYEALRELRGKMSMVFQDPYSSLDPRKSAGKQIEIPLEIHHVSDRKGRKEIVKNLLVDVGLSEYHALRYPHEFSGGQRQRINVARALAVNPEFIIFDEPVSALDVSVQSQVLNLLNKLKEERDLTYMFISHDLSVVKYISDRIAVMYLGHVVEISDSETIYKNPAHPYTRALLSSIPPDNPHDKIKDDSNLIKGEVSSPLDLPRGCAFSSRCPYVSAICREQQPELLQIGNKHKVACLKYKELNVEALTNEKI